MERKTPKKKLKNKQFSPETPKSRAGFVYFIRQRSDVSLFKIGRTINPVKERLVQLQTGNPKELVIFAFIETEDAVALENYFHKKFADRRHRNEWFRISHRVIAREASRFQGYQQQEIIPSFWCRLCLPF